MALPALPPVDSRVTIGQAMCDGRRRAYCDSLAALPPVEAGAFPPVDAGALDAGLGGMVGMEDWVVLMLGGEEEEN